MPEGKRILVAAVLVCGLLIVLASNGRLPSSVLFWRRADPAIMAQALAAGDDTKFDSELAKGLDVDELNNRDSILTTHTSPFHSAALQGNLKALDQLLQKGVKINLKNEGGETALTLASAAGRLDAVQFLLSKLANSNVETFSTGQHMKALQLAVAGGHADVVRALLKGGVSRNDPATDRAFVAAAMNGDSDVVRVFLAEHVGGTILAAAAARDHGHPEIARIIESSDPISPQNVNRATRLLKELARLRLEAAVATNNGDTKKLQELEVRLRELQAEEQKLVKIP